MISIIESFLSDRKQRVTIDGKFSEWAVVQAGVPQGSLLGPIIFLVFINDLVEVVESNINIFADDTFIFRIVDQFSTEILNRDLERISRWSWQWKLSFNPDLTKQAVEIVFSNKKIKNRLEPLVFNGIPVKEVGETKHLGMILDSKLTFENHMTEKLAKARQGLGVMKQLKKWVDKKTLENVYKLYVRPQVEYGDLVFDHVDLNKSNIFTLRNTNDKISTDIESIQYQAARIVSGAWKGSSMEKLYNILGWESMQNRRTMRKLDLLHQTLNNKFPNYLYNILEVQMFRPDSRYSNRLMLRNITTKTTKYKKSFFPATILDWNKLDFEIKTSKSKNIFKKKVLNKIRPKKAPYFGLIGNENVRHITTLRLGLSPLNAHKHSYNFADTPLPFCRICESIEDTTHFLLLCKSFRLLRSTLMQNVSNILGLDILTLPRRRIINVLLYGREDMSFEKNKSVLEEVAKYILLTKRFDRKSNTSTLLPVPREEGGNQQI